MRIFIWLRIYLTFTMGTMGTLIVLLILWRTRSPSWWRRCSDCRPRTPACATAAPRRSPSWRRSSRWRRGWLQGWKCASRRSTTTQRSDASSSMSHFLFALHQLLEPLSVRERSIFWLITAFSLFFLSYCIIFSDHPQYSLLFSSYSGLGSFICTL